MAKNTHEIRDPIHVFVRLDSYERQVLNSRPFQRLRHIHQLALSHLVYPGATHKRFEHSLGVMELAGRVFDVITRRDAVQEEIRELLPEIDNASRLTYWRSALRMAALCHDLGHLPFSHTGEGLLPKGWDHERLTVDIIMSKEMEPIWEDMKLDPKDIAKLAVGPEDAAELGLGAFSTWQEILAEIIVGDAFGVDRMDYLLRDSYHAGVTYGRFDHYRLIDTLRILTAPPLKRRIKSTENKKLESESKEALDESTEPMLGVEKGGLHSAESLLLARYFMFSQVYCHPVRRIYDIHLRDFLKEWLPKGTFGTTIAKHMSLTDAEVTSALRRACKSKRAKGHEHARRILNREHFKVLYTRNPDDIEQNPDAVEVIHSAAQKKFGAEHVRVDAYTQRGGAPDFPVLEKDGRIVSSLAESQTLKNLPVVATGYVFVSRECQAEALAWLQQNREDILASEEKEKSEQ